jgi:hypothetical protein
VKGEMKIQIPLDSEEKGQIVKENEEKGQKERCPAQKRNLIPLIFPAS